MGGSPDYVCECGDDDRMGLNCDVEAGRLNTLVSFVIVDPAWPLLVYLVADDSYCSGTGIAVNYLLFILENTKLPSLSIYSLKMKPFEKLKSSSS